MGNAVARFEVMAQDRNTLGKGPLRRVRMADRHRQPHRLRSHRALGELQRGRVGIGGLFGDMPAEQSGVVGHGTISREDNLDASRIGIGGGLMALPSEMAAGSNARVSWCVEVPGVAAAMRRAEALGGRRLMGPESVPAGPTPGRIADPEGRLVGLVQAGTM